MWDEDGGIGYKPVENSVETNAEGLASTGVGLWAVWDTLHMRSGSISCLISNLLVCDPVAAAL